MKDLYLDFNTKDLATTTNFDLKFTENNSEFVSTKMENKLSFFKGEWFLDRTQGVPYFESVLVKNPDINLINTIFLTQIVSITEIQEVISFETQYFPDTRNFQVSYKVLVDDTTISNTILI